MLVAEEYENGRLVAGLQLNDGTCALKPIRGPRKLVRALQGAFLPEGYPASVTKDYVAYQVWDSVQALATYVRGILSSQALLQGVGVGRATATPLGAVLQFFVKDMAGMLGGILFAMRQGSGLDAFAKPWRLFADVANDLGLALELASPHFPGAFLALACAGSICRAVVGVAGGATRMALTQHFALQRNAADIAAKEGSQETLTTLLGMVLGMAFTSYASSSPALVWTLFLALTWLHIYANVRAMRCLHITSLNQARLATLLRCFITSGAVLTPTQMAGQESLVPPPFLALLRAVGLRRGEVAATVAPSLSHLAPAARAHVAEQLVSGAFINGSSLPFLVLVPPGGAADTVLLLLREDATAESVLQGTCVALLHGWHEQLRRGGVRAQQQTWAPGARRALEQASGWAEDGYTSFRAALMAAGWAVDRVALQQGQTRLRWGGGLQKRE